MNQQEYNKARSIRYRLVNQLKMWIFVLIVVSIVPLFITGMVLAPLATLIVIGLIISTLFVNKLIKISVQSFRIRKYEKRQRENA